MTASQMWGHVTAYWRVPLVAIVAGVLAFGGSFVMPTQYESTTQLLLRGRDSALLTGDGGRLSEQSGVIDSHLSTALAETQSALMSSRAVATMVVDDLGLPLQDEADASLWRRLRSGVGDATRRARAYLQYGFYAEPEPRAAAIAEVHENLSARPLEDSYVIELAARAGSPELARDVADSAAASLIDVGMQRLREEAESHRDFLARQLANARTQEAAAAGAVRDFKEEHGVGDLGLDRQLYASSTEDLRSELRSTEVELQGTRAQLSAIQAARQSTSETSSNTSEIETGRSTTVIESAGSNAVYQSLVTEEALLEGQVASLESRLASLEELLAARTSGTLGDVEAELLQLTLQHEIASDAVTDLSTRHREAVINADSERFEITRLDAANLSTFPVAPRRHLFLAAGLLLGAIAGLLLTYLASWRREETDVVTSAPAANGQHADSQGTNGHHEAALDLTALENVPNDTKRLRSSTGRFEVFSLPEVRHNGANGSHERDPAGGGPDDTAHDSR